MNAVQMDTDGTFYVAGKWQRSLNVKTRDEAYDMLMYINEWGWRAYNEGRYHEHKNKGAVWDSK